MTIIADMNQSDSQAATMMFRSLEGEEQGDDSNTGRPYQMRAAGMSSRNSNEP